jgi:hypothetical protein
MAEGRSDLFVVLFFPGADGIDFPAIFATISIVPEG